MKRALITATVVSALTVLRMQAADARKSDYLLKTCVVSGEKLDDMGKPYVFNYQGREVHFCCKDCVKDFNKDPQKYLKKLDDAEKAAKKS